MLGGRIEVQLIHHADRWPISQIIFYSLSVIHAAADVRRFFESLKVQLLHANLNYSCCWSSLLYILSYSALLYYEYNAALSDNLIFSKFLLLLLLPTPSFHLVIIVKVLRKARVFAGAIANSFRP